MKLLNFSLCILLSVLFIPARLGVIASEYPQSELEDEIESMGSLAGTNGVTIKSSNVPNKSSYVKNRQLQYSREHLFAAALEVLIFAPLASADSAAGVVITEWYVPKNDTKTQLKITVYIKNLGSKDIDIDVVVFERHRERSGWSAHKELRAVAKSLKEKIMIKAKNLALKSAK
jgi:hypothetical protein